MGGFSLVMLPNRLDAGDLKGVRDQIAARIEAVLHAPGKEGKAKEKSKGVLPEGVRPVKELPRAVDVVWGHFDQAVNEMLAVQSKRDAAEADKAGGADSEQAKRDANEDSDDRWRAFSAWVAGAAALADDGKGASPAEARWLNGQLFAGREGLRFITAGPRKQWGEMEKRMEVLGGERAQAVIGGLHGERHFAQLKRAHERFGAAYGFTKAVAEPADAPTNTVTEFQAAKEALREFVQKVEGTAVRGIEGSEELALYLLGPYAELVADYEASPSAKPKKGDGKGEDEKGGGEKK